MYVIVSMVLLCKKTDFAFEVIVHDDASTDGTKEIIQEYADRYPNIIKPIFETDNQYSKVGFGGIKRIVKPYLKGKYIAFCEGDDYWIDSCKLQKQMQIFRENEQIDFVFTNIDYLYEESGKRINRFLTTNGRRVSKTFLIICLILISLPHVLGCINPSSF